MNFITMVVCDEMLNFSGARDDIQLQCGMLCNEGGLLSDSVSQFRLFFSQKINVG